MEAVNASDAIVLETPPVEASDLALPAPPVGNRPTFRTRSVQIARRFQPLQNARLKKAVLAQDGHTLAEQIIYSALSTGGDDVGAPYRDIAVGNRWIMARTGLSERTVQLNLKSLQMKLSIEILRRHNPDTNEPTLYRVYSLDSILERRRGAGLDLVAKKRGGGVRLVRSETLAASSTPGVSNAVNPVVAALNVYGPATEEGARDLMTRCRMVAPDLVEEELVHLIHQKLPSGRVRTAPLAFLLVALPRFLEGEGLRRFREQRQRDQEAAAADDLRLAREILARSDAGPDERAWAEETLQDPR
jgi:hypothetical protein